MKEELRPYPVLPNYLVSNFGRVFGPGSGPKGKPVKYKELTRIKNKTGYPMIAIKPLSRLICLHRIVAETFHGPCPAGMQCAHLDGTRDNCAASNLKWVTPSENASHKHTHGTAYLNRGKKLSAESALGIKRDLASGMAMKKIARKYGVGPTTIHGIKTGRLWRHITLQE
jgi:hypothetical protein